MTGEKKDVYVYTYHGGVYINPTNHCTNNCIFCLRNDRDGVADVESPFEPQTEQPGGTFAPFRHPAFRAIGIAHPTPDPAATVHWVGAAWLTTDLTDPLPGS